VLGLFKKKVPVEHVARDMAVMLGGVLRGLFLSQSMHGRSHPSFDGEAVIFTYILGWYAIQNSDLNRVDKHKCSAKLGTAWLAELEIEDHNLLVMQRHLHQRLIEYRDALFSGKGGGPLEQLSLQLLGYVRSETSNQVEFIREAVDAATVAVHALQTFLSDVSREHKLV
jgi:hypothetical protein